MSEKSVASPLGAVVREGDGYRLEFVRTFPDPIERIWAALTDSTELQGWYGTWQGDPSTGSIEVTFCEAPGDPGIVQILECDAPRRLGIVVPSPDGDWPLSVDLEAIVGGTQLTFVHRLAEPYDATSSGPGWHYYMDRLNAHLEGSEPTEDWSAYELLGPQYALPE